MRDEGGATFWNNCQHECWERNEGDEACSSTRTELRSFIYSSYSYCCGGEIKVCPTVSSDNKQTYTLSSHTSLSNLAIFTLREHGKHCVREEALKILRYLLSHMVTDVLLTLGPSSPGGPGGPVEPCSPWGGKKKTDERSGRSPKSTCLNCTAWELKKVSIFLIHGMNWKIM